MIHAFLFDRNNISNMLIVRKSVKKNVHIHSERIIEISSSEMVTKREIFVFDF